MMWWFYQGHFSKYLSFWFSIKLDMCKLDISWTLYFTSTDTEHSPIIFSHKILEGRFGGITEFAKLMKLKLCCIFFSETPVEQLFQFMLR